jgi:hypothetical protein
MSEEQNEGTWSSLKKTIVGTVATVITGAGAWIGTTMFGGGDAAQPAPQQAQPVINVNMTNNQQQQAATKTVIVKEKADNSSENVKPKAEKKKDEWAKEEPKW